MYPRVRTCGDDNPFYSLARVAVFAGGWVDGIAKLDLEQEFEPKQGFPSRPAITVGIFFQFGGSAGIPPQHPRFILWGMGKRTHTPKVKGKI